MKLFWKLLKHELKLPFEVTGLFILLFVGIIFLTVLFGGVYLHAYVNDIPVVVLDEDNSSKSRMVINYFDNNERFHIQYFAQDREELKEKIDSGKAQLGIYIPPDFGEDILKMKATQVILYTDGSNVIIGNNAYAYAATIVQTIGAGVEMKLLSAKGALPQVANHIALAFQFNDRILYDPKMTYLNYLLLGFIAIFLQQIMMSSLSASVFYEIDTVKSNNTAARILAKIIGCGTYALLSMWTAVWIAASVFHVTIIGNLFTAFLISFIFVFAISAPAIFLITALKTKNRFAQVAYMLSLPTFLVSGCVWPTDQMPPLLLAINKIIWPLVYFAKPFHEILIKGIPFQTVLAKILMLLAYTVIWLPLSIYYFKSSVGHNVMQAHTVPNSDAEISNSVSD